MTELDWLFMWTKGYYRKIIKNSSVLGPLCSDFFQYAAIEALDKGLLKLKK